MANSPHEMFNRAVEAQTKKDLRDQFAQAALAAIANTISQPGYPNDKRYMADAAWGIADEMMLQRDMTPEQRKERLK